MAKKVIKDFDYENFEEAKKIYPKNEGYSTHYVVREKNQELDLHRPYIDDIFVAHNKSFIAKKVLGVH